MGTRTGRAGGSESAHGRRAGGGALHGRRRGRRGPGGDGARRAALRETGRRESCHPTRTFELTRTRQSRRQTSTNLKHAAPRATKGPRAHAPPRRRRRRRSPTATAGRRGHLAEAAGPQPPGSADASRAAGDESGRRHSPAPPPPFPSSDPSSSSSSSSSPLLRPASGSIAARPRTLRPAGPPPPPLPPAPDVDGPAPAPAAAAASGALRLVPRKPSLRASLGGGRGRRRRGAGERAPMGARRRGIAPGRVRRQRRGRVERA
jgi:hypothetical protein